MREMPFAPRDITGPNVVPRRFEKSKMWFLCCSVLCVSLLGADRVQAKDLNDFLEPIPGHSACWARIYSRDHLSKHPHQKVTEIHLALGYNDLEPNQSDTGEYAFSIDVTTRERSGSEVGLCHVSDLGKPVCAIECDGGAFELRASRHEGSLLIELLSGGLRLEDCGSETSFWLEAEPSDRLFLVHPVSCEED